MRTEMKIDYMLVSDLLPKADGKVKFNYSALDKSPAESGCYIITTFDGTILYIGQSDNIRRRMEEHLDEKEKTKETPWGVSFWLYYKLYDKTKLNELEREWTNEYKLKMGKRPHFSKNDPPI